MVLFVGACAGCERAGPAAPSSSASSAAPASSAPLQGVAPPPSPSKACGDTVGAWSSVVDGLRGRLVTSGSKPDHSALRIVLELENKSGRPLDLHWTGNHLGFATFRLEDEAGKDPEPGWRLGGNEATGNLRATLSETAPTTYVVHDGPFGSMNGGRILRIGAFWGRELPGGGARRSLRAVVVGGPANPDAAPLAGSASAPTTARGRPWTGRLELPPVCVE